MQPFRRSRLHRISLLLLPVFDRLVLVDPRVKRVRLGQVRLHQRPIVHVRRLQHSPLSWRQFPQPFRLYRRPGATGVVHELGRETVEQRAALVVRVRPGNRAVDRRLCRTALSASWRGERERKLCKKFTEEDDDIPRGGRWVVDHVRLSLHELQPRRHWVVTFV